MSLARKIRLRLDLDLHSMVRIQKLEDLRIMQPMLLYNLSNPLLKLATNRRRSKDRRAKLHLPRRGIMSQTTIWCSNCITHHNQNDFQSSMKCSNEMYSSRISWPNMQ